MRALIYNAKESQFEVHDLPIPEPGPNDVLVRVDACGLNPVDAKIVRWKSAATDTDMQEAWIPGLDVSGWVEKIGSQVKLWKPGDRVLCHGNMFRPHGGFAEYSIQNAATLLRHPRLDSVTAAATPCAGWTAWRAIERLRAKEEDSMLITGGSGGVGGFSTQIARWIGLKTIIATCSARNAEYVKGLGATHIIDYQKEDIACRVLEITENRGVTLGVDTVGGDNDIAVANSLAFEGQMVELVDTLRPAMYREAFRRGLGMHQLNLGSGHRYGTESQQAMVEAGRAFSTLVVSGEIKVPVLHQVTLEETGAALAEILKQRTVGKIVLVFQNSPANEAG